MLRRMAEKNAAISQLVATLDQVNTNAEGK
jgi:hypothetical protein